VVILFRKVLAVAAFAVLVAGCADTTDGGGSTIAPTITESTGEPKPEPTTPETTGTKVNKPSINIPNAPIGGSGPDQEGIEQCVEVNWLQNPLPDGATVTFDSIGLDPEKVFKLDQSACDGDARSCTGLKQTVDSRQACFVGGRQVGPGPGDTDNVYVIIEATVTCETKADCQSVKENSDGSSVTFQAEEIETPTSETPSEQPSPVETPSDG
jgi:hypothetical protein